MYFYCVNGILEWISRDYRTFQEKVGKCRNTMKVVPI